MWLLGNGSVAVAAGGQEDNECPRVAAGWEFPARTGLPEAGTELGGGWEAAKGRVVFWVFWLGGVSVAGGFCRELPPEQVPGDTVLFQDLLTLLPLSQAHPGCQRMGWEAKCLSGM